jgi:hypothetical protein
MDYANAKIYKITGGGLTYYGSTTQPLYKRMYRHKTLTYSSKIIMETGEAIIVLVELFPCKSKEELFSRERYWIENNECVNKCRPIRTKEEKKEQVKQWCIDNANKSKEQRKHYENNNIDKIKERQKQYRIDNTDKIKEQKKQNYIKNIDKIKARKKQYYLDNK